MAKSIALIALFFLCTGLGMRGASALERRAQMLSALIGSVKRLMTRLEYARLPLSQLLCTEDFGEAGALWRLFGEELQSGLSPDAAWTAAIHSASADDRSISSLSDADRAALLRFASGLGKYDVRTQKEQAELLLAELADSAREAERQYGKKGRVYRAMGVLSGAAVCILLV